MDSLFQDPKIFAILCFAVGFILIMALAFVLAAVRRSQSKAEAARIIADAEELAQDLHSEAKARLTEFSEVMQSRAEKENAIIEERIEKLQARIQDREEVLQDKLKLIERSIQTREQDINQYAEQVEAREKVFQAKKDSRRAFLQNLTKKLEEKTETPSTEIKTQLQKRFLEDTQIEASKMLQSVEEVEQERVEQEAKKYLNMAINRFARPYCPERGIGYLNFENDGQRDRVLGPEQKNLRIVEKLCGVDLVYDQPHNAVNVYGFDPVRRELGRATVEKLMTERHITPERIEQLVAKTKKDLFQKIIQDGNRISNELKLEGLHPEIKNMMGALRYRYSFTQNQHFHCAEVGFLCGLLASELGVPLKDARRAGMLHDLGKAMDHSVDGGHAVIGADFIKQHGEADHIVHAVRAHHFDEQPNSDLAYLVIAADAISGARPGARRSTAASYTQKIQDLQTIASGFDGVTDTHVLSAGREIRVYVDGRKMDDLHSLQLSRDIAHKIENEMQYPGQIKVTVVRETQAIEMAK